MFEISSQPVVAKTRRLKAAWSLEAARNLLALHGVEESEWAFEAAADPTTNELVRRFLQKCWGRIKAGFQAWSIAFDKASTGNGLVLTARVVHRNGALACAIEWLEEDAVTVLFPFPGELNMLDPSVVIRLADPDSASKIADAIRIAIRGQ